MANGQRSTRDIVISTETMVNGLIKKVDGLADCIHGTDAQPGMRSDIRSLKVDVNNLQEEKKKKDDRRRQLRLLTVTEVLTALGLIASIVFK